MKKITALILSVIMAILITIVISRVLKPSNASAVPMTEIVVTRTKIEADTPISPNQVMVVSIPVANTNPADAHYVSQVVGMEPKYTIPDGEIIYKYMIQRNPQRSGVLAGEVPFRVQATNFADGSVVPGERVDIYAWIPQSSNSTTVGPNAALMNSIMDLDGSALIKGARVIDVVNNTGTQVPVYINSSGAPTIGSVSTKKKTANVDSTLSAQNTTPAGSVAAIDLAVTKQEANELVVASNLGKLTIIPDPWVEYNSNGIQQASSPGNTSSVSSTSTKKK